MQPFENSQWLHSPKAYSIRQTRIRGCVTLTIVNNERSYLGSKLTPGVLFGGGLSGSFGRGLGRRLGETEASSSSGGAKVGPGAVALILPLGGLGGVWAGLIKGESQLQSHLGDH